MSSPFNKRDFSRQLRRRSTDAERRLWYHLRGRRFAECKFRRQVLLGKYIADFASHEKRLVIELDGGQHFADPRKDVVRDAWLRGQGYDVLRFPDNAVFKELEGVLETVWRAVGGTPSGEGPEGKAG